MKQKPTDYRNRIKALEYVNAADLTPHPGNWRAHPAAQAEALKGVLAEVGIAGALLAYRSERQGGALVVIDGHLRKDAAPQAWPVLILDVDDAEADYLLATHDPLAAMATADAGALDALLSSVQSGEAAVQQMLADLAEGAGLYQPQDDPQDADPQIDRAEELREKWGVEPGQLWRLASRTPGQEHRLICGDCTDGAVVERVMGGERADMVWTDPPYGVAIGEKNKFLNSIARSNRIEENLEGDRLEEPQLVELLGRAFDAALPCCSAGGAWYVAAPAGPLHVLFGQVLKDRGIWRQTIQWVKNNATFAPLGVDYHWRAEPIFYGWKPGAAHNYYGGRQQDTVWNVDRPQKSPEHPTMKPVELVQRAVENSSLSGGIVLDSFVGSGTTLIAAENLSRQCRAVEISPGYCAVALERYLDAFGIRGELVDTFAFEPAVMDSRPQIRADEVPDALWPSDNALGIPTLLLDRQAPSLEMPVQKWGQQGRRLPHLGTYHFYTDDYKFAALWDDPTPVINSGCPSVVEINFSIQSHTPAALVASAIYKKRWLSRYWQENGIDVIVDLGVPPEFLDLNAQGIPAGWRIFATRVYESDDYASDLEAQYNVARRIRGGDDVAFLVFSKSKEIKRLCHANGWQYVQTISF